METEVVTVGVLHEENAPEVPNVAIESFESDEKLREEIDHKRDADELMIVVRTVDVTWRALGM